MFDHYDSIAYIPYTLESVEQSVRVPGMKSYRGFVQNIQNSGELRADLRGKPYPLALPAAQRVGTP